MALSCSYDYNKLYSTIVQEETWFQGNLLSNVFFGVHSALCVVTFSTVFKTRSSHGGRMRIILLVYIAVLFVITTIAQVFLDDLIQTAFVTQQDYPGGPSAFLSDACTVPANLATYILVVFANWMMEFLLVWRCHVVCSAGEHPWWFGVTIPFVLLMTVFVTGSLFIYHILNATSLTISVLAYAVSSLALNFTATGFIAGRLLFHRYHAINQLGRGYGQQYVSIVTVVVESAAIYTSFLIVVIVAYATGSLATNFLQQNIEQVQSIASLLTILRIARGEAWTKKIDMELIYAMASSQLETTLIRSDVTSTATQLNEEANVPDESVVPNTITMTESCVEVKLHAKDGTRMI